MTSYRVHLSGISEVAVDVEALTAEEAIEKAYDEPTAELCARCSGRGTAWQYVIPGTEFLLPDAVELKGSTRTPWRSTERWERVRDSGSDSSNSAEVMR